MGSLSQSSSPWTEMPKCIPKENSTLTYCVYTSDVFANGRGISFFTTPSVAERVAALPAFTRKDLYDKVNIFDDPPWEIKVIPGRGRGLFATRTLYRGDRIVAATPVGVYLSDALVPDFKLGYIYLHTAFIHLPKPTQQLFLSAMAGSEGDPIMERVNTNAFSGDFEGEPHFLMYPETARMNHDCRPNAMYYYDPKTLIHSTIAARTIEPGEEITIPYDNILRQRSERQKSLSNYWGFQCTCSLCSSSATETARSDTRIAEIIELQTELANWSPWSTGTPTKAEMLISLYEEEHLHAAKATGHTFAALAYNAVGDKMMAEWHAELALEAGMVNSGPNDDERAMKQLLNDPEGHWSWMARKQTREL
ncbi:hypothetical protein M430DRAFT_110591 [Amorphotheca resinae ATCC 22711]|uniref:SET domain-containing protein n=1 Tax=Amorphotheca resinae ATCC 22711 TaxID=857342 RepID=A0A2T3AQ69_AMORE|nr:hypothetical protein M430DRAFT_110591 [Amorphotheca resinae ATCC 22711]PSS07150.1 hypothetical protein M430DRAFT_110591 [Amorphotheca resinae ATCC 22711]